LSGHDIIAWIVLAILVARTGRQARQVMGRAKGWTVVDMKQDWKAVFPPQEKAQ